MVWNLEGINNYRDKIKFPLKLHLKICCQCDSSINLGFSNSSDGKESSCNAGGLGLITGQEDALEKGRGTHSSILVWRVPWTEEPGRLQSMGLKRVGHDWVTNPLSINLAFIEGLLYATWYQHLGSSRPSISVSFICKKRFDCKIFILTIP